nr:ATP-binding protein [Brevibacterium yomogidense]
MAECGFVAKAENVILLGPPGVGKTHLPVGPGMTACHAGYPFAFNTATGVGRVAYPQPMTVRQGSTKSSNGCVGIGC